MKSAEIKSPALAGKKVDYLPLAATLTMVSSVGRSLAMWTMTLRTWSGTGGVAELSGRI